jgi:membrane protein DedA with SNARE-associated domain
MERALSNRSTSLLIRIGISRFLVYSGLGTAIWSGMLAGYGLEEQYQKVASYVKPASNVIFGLIVAW